MPDLRFLNDTEKKPSFLKGVTNRLSNIPKTAIAQSIAINKAMNEPVDSPYDWELDTGGGIDPKTNKPRDPQKYWHPTRLQVPRWEAVLKQGASVALIGKIGADAVRTIISSPQVQLKLSQIATKPEFQNLNKGAIFDMMQKITSGQGQLNPLQSKAWQRLNTDMSRLADSYKAGRIESVVPRRGFGLLARGFGVKPPSPVTPPAKGVTPKGGLPAVRPTLQPKAGGLAQEAPALVKKYLDKGVTITSREAPIRMTTDHKIKDVQGNKVTLPKGEEYTPFKLSNNKIWLHDGKNIVVDKGQLQNVEKKNLVLGETEESKKLEGTTVVDEKGKPKIVFSGHSNVALYGKFDPKKSTAGGFFATEDPAIASNYAEGKMGVKETFERGSQYRLEGKGGKLNKKIGQIELTPKQIEIIEKLKKDKEESISQMDHWVEFSKDYDKDARRMSFTGGSHNLQNIFDFFEQSGYNIAYSDQAARVLPDGAKLEDRSDYIKRRGKEEGIDTYKDEKAYEKYSEEHQKLYDSGRDLSVVERQNKNRFEELLDALGIKWSSYDWAQPGVIPTYLAIKNPLDTSKLFPEDLMSALKQKAKFERTRTEEQIGYAHWTKDYPLKQWIKDIESGNEFWSTQIPKKAIPIFKQFGYDGIKDTGGKGGGEKHPVWIAFDAEQVIPFSKQIKPEQPKAGGLPQPKGEGEIKAPFEATVKKADADIKRRLRLLPPEPPKIPPEDVEGLGGPGNEGENLVESYEKQKDIWFQNKDERIFLAQVERRNLQNSIKQALGKPKYDKEAQNYDKAIQIYLDSKRNPEHINKYYSQLTDEQKKIVDLSQNLPEPILAIANKIQTSYGQIGTEALGQEVIKNVLDNYVARVWDIEGKRGVEQFRKFGITTRHAKARKFETIIEGWANNFTLKVEGATNNLEILKNEIVKTIEDKKFIKSLQKIKTLDGEQLLSTKQLEGYARVEHPNFKQWKYAGKVDVEQPDILNPYESQVKKGIFARNSFVDDKGNVFERKELYAPKDMANNLNNILGISKLKGKPVIDTLTKYNAIIKAWILQSSFFHHLAFIRSYWFGTNHKKWNEMSPRQAYKQGIRAIEQEDAIVKLGVRNGLTLGIKQDWSEELLKEKTIIGNTLDKWKVTKVVKDKIMELRQRQADFLFGEFGAGLKAKAFTVEYRNLLKKHPNKNTDDLAKMAANLINDDFGGLHLQRLGRDPTLQHIFRLFALAPDWTESNIRTMVKSFKAGSKEEEELYRSFWAGILKKGVLLSVLANISLSGKDTWKNYKESFEDWGRFRWLDVDITKLYKAFGGTSRDKKYFSIFGHFKDPAKFITHPIRSAHHKGSVLYKFFHEALTGVDWAGRRFTTFPELAGFDREKGLYKTTRKGLYKKGDPKYGKLKGKSVVWDYGKRGPLDYKQIPSFILSQLKGTQPIQIQNLLSWVAGELAGFDAVAKSAGLRVGTKYAPKKKKKLRLLK